MTLKQQALSGVKWTGISMGVVTVLHLITLLVMARRLTPGLDKLDRNWELETTGYFVTARKL